MATVEIYGNTVNQVMINNSMNGGLYAVVITLKDINGVPLSIMTVNGDTVDYSDMYFSRLAQAIRKGLK